MSALGQNCLVHLSDPLSVTTDTGTASLGILKRGEPEPIHTMTIRSKCAAAEMAFNSLKIGADSLSTDLVQDMTAV